MQRLVVISGLSGAGKGVALHALEDLGYYCVDNLPLVLLPALADGLGQADEPRPDRAAVVVDARNLSVHFEHFHDTVRDVAARGFQVEVVFLAAQAEVLVKRFSETRRRHPLTEGAVTLEEAIRREGEVLEPIRRAADLFIDTTRTHFHELRNLVRERVGGREGGLSLLFESFGFKHGVPSDADLVFDARFLPNPYWQPQLRALDGRDEAVARYLESAPQAIEMAASLEDFIGRWLPEYIEDNRAYLTVAIGCTGGHHRSVFLVERLAAHFRTTHQDVMIRHRELSSGG